MTRKLKICKWDLVREILVNKISDYAISNLYVISPDSIREQCLAWDIPNADDETRKGRIAELLAEYWQRQAMCFKMEYERDQTKVSAVH